MDFTVCSRNALRDYTWDNSRASYPVTEYAQNFFAPAFEGSLTTSRFAGLFRCPGSPRGVMLGVSASTQRKDAVSRPIRTMAFLRAETEEEAVRLAAFFAECLRKPDGQSLLDATSPVALAVESIYQTKDVRAFLRYSCSLSVPSGRSGCLQGRLAIPRTDMDARNQLADSLPGVIAGDAPFLLLLADREPEAVFKSSGSLFNKGPVRIYSKAVSAIIPLVSVVEKDGPKKNRPGRGEGGLVIAGITLLVCGLAWLRAFDVGLWKKTGKEVDIPTVGINEDGHCATGIQVATGVNAEPQGPSRQETGEGDSTVKQGTTPIQVDPPPNDEEKTGINLHDEQNMNGEAPVSPILSENNIQPSFGENGQEEATGSTSVSTPATSCFDFIPKVEAVSEESRPIDTPPDSHAKPGDKENDGAMIASPELALQTDKVNIDCKSQLERMMTEEESSPPPLSEIDECPPHAAVNVPQTIESESSFPLHSSEPEIVFSDDIHPGQDDSSTQTTPRKSRHRGHKKHGLKQKNYEKSANSSE